MNVSVLRRLWWLAPLALLAVALFDASAKDPSKPLVVIPPTRNMVNTTDKEVFADFSVEDGQEKNVLWKASLGGTSYGGPVVAGGKVFVGTNNDKPRDPKITGDRGVLMCFDAKTGKFLWQAVHDKLPTGEPNDYPKQGIASSATVEGDRVYYVSNRCELCCADVKGDGKGKARFHWKLDMIGKLGVFPCQLAVCSPLIVGDLVFCVTGNGADVISDPRTLPAPDAPSFIAVNKKNGEVVWKDSSPGKNIMEGQWSNPVFAAPKGGKPQVIFPGGDGWLYAFDAVKPDKPLWKFNCNPRKSVYDPKNSRKSDRNSILATPVIYDDKVYVGVGHDPQRGPGVGHLWCIDATKSGDVSPVDDNFDPKAEVNKKSALVWHYGGRVLPRPMQGRDVYFGRTLATCAIHDGLLYVTELDGYVNCFDAKTGKKHWMYDMHAETWCSAYWVAGKVFVGNEDGDLHIFDAGKALKEPKKITFNGPLKTPVVVTGGILYILTDSTLYAIGKK
jgi:outer membrane protein assembly factor BamB